jgi:hypothetical protein
MIKKLKNSFLQIPYLFQINRRLDYLQINQGRILSKLNNDLHATELGDYEFKIFSQWGEDGILQHLINCLEIKNKTFIEFGVENFYESNCRFLLMKDYWSGFVIDGSEANISSLKKSYFYWQYQLNCIASFITRENVNSLLSLSKFDTEVGILSIDIDGVDFHVLEALSNWRPSILIVEYNDVFGFDRPVSVPYDPEFVRRKKHWSNQYWGANLPAFIYLSNQRGYALVGTNKVGSNAFFVRRELLNDRVEEVSLASCRRETSFRDSRDPKGNLTFLSGFERSKAIFDLPLLDIETNQMLKVGDLILGD